MPINYQAALRHAFPPVEGSYTRRDAQLYALSTGWGRDPLDPLELPFVYEHGFKVAPTFAATLGFVSIRDANLGIDYTRVVHGAQALTLHSPLPEAADYRCVTRIAEIIDRGAGKGAIIELERTLTERHHGTLLATSVMSAFCRADGGFGGPVTSAPPPHPLPDDPPDHEIDLAPPAHGALLYRLNGDYNPLHADPEFARRAGFDRPVLHGLAVYGEVARVALTHLAEGDVSRFESITCRFTSPVFPGEALRCQLWQRNATVSFRVLVTERGVTALDNGRIELRGPARA